jgi:hypothetical protein
MGRIIVSLQRGHSWSLQWGLIEVLNKIDVARRSGLVVVSTDGENINGFVVELVDESVFL